MGSPRPFVGGNWKMHGDRAGAGALARKIAAGAAGLRAEVVLFPPFVHLAEARAAIEGAALSLGAQDLYYEREGAFTGEISAAMLLDAGCAWAIAGHSERRHVIGESDALVARKTRAALDAGLSCVLCVGETLEERRAGETDEVNERQLRAALVEVPSAHAERLVVAYEPVWAIGAGDAATPRDAQAAHERIREILLELWPETGSQVRIVYGGSVKADNAAELFAQPAVDGGLIGGASLRAEEFLTICAEAQRACAPSEGTTR